MTDDEASSMTVGTGGAGDDPSLLRWLCRHLARIAIPSLDFYIASVTFDRSDHAIKHDMQDIRKWVNPEELA